MEYKLFPGKKLIAAITLFIAVTSYGQEIILPDSTSGSSPNTTSGSLFNFELSPPTTNLLDDAGYDLLAPTTEKPPRTPKFKPEYYPDFYVSKSPLHKGDYNVSGALKSFKKGVIYGIGRQEQTPGIGTMNFAGVGYQHHFNDRLSMNVLMNATKTSVPNFNFRGQMFGTSGNFSYRLNDKLSLNAFGAYSMSPSNSFKTYSYGGTLDYEITERFGTEVGVRRYYSSSFGRWETIPVVIPYFKLGDSKLGMDVGGLLKELLFKAVKVDRRPGNPTIMPSFP